MKGFTYSRTAIPTTYAGVNFRSRLEARWAAMFDLLKWEWKYEPIDLNGWMPDFYVNTGFGKFTEKFYVEVKPVDKLTRELKLACRKAARVLRNTDGLPNTEFCLFGNGPHEGWQLGVGVDDRLVDRHHVFEPPILDSDDFEIIPDDFTAENPHIITRFYPIAAVESCDGHFGAWINWDGPDLSWQWKVAGNKTQWNK